MCNSNVIYLCFVDIVDLGRIPTLVNVFVDNNPLLNWLPLSLKSTTSKINFGINRYVNKKFQLRKIT